MSDTRRMRANTGNRIALGILILLVALFIFICTCGAFGGVGDMVSSVFVGFFGLADYAYSLVAARQASRSFSISKSRLLRRG